MHTLCPVCNGFNTIASTCTHCGLALQDKGRLTDFYGCYSPYLEIDDTKQANGFPDLAFHLCMHVAWCSLCQTEQIIGVEEWSSY